MEALLDFVQLHGVRLHTHVCASNQSATEWLKATSLAKTQAENTKWPVTNQFHQALDLDQWGRWLITMLDGKTPPAVLASQLTEKLAESGISVDSAQVLEIVETYLVFFRQQEIAN